MGQRKASGVGPLLEILLFLPPSVGVEVKLRSSHCVTLDRLSYHSILSLFFLPFFYYTSTGFN